MKSSKKNNTILKFQNLIPTKPLRSNFKTLTSQSSLIFDRFGWFRSPNWHSQFFFMAKRLLLMVGLDYPGRLPHFLNFLFSLVGARVLRLSFESIWYSCKAFSYMRTRQVCSKIERLHRTVRLESYFSSFRYIFLSIFIYGPT